MANFKKHANTGILLGIITGIIILIFKNKNEEICSETVIEIMVGAVLGSFLGAIIPDVMDYPTNPNHRSFAHSVTANSIIFLKLITNMNITEEIDGNFTFFTAFGIGYFSHCFIDMQTPKGLPIVL